VVRTLTKSEKTGQNGSGLGLIRKRMAEGWNPPVAELIGFRLVSATRGAATVELEAGKQHSNPMGTLHGGVICDIADAAMGIAYVTTLRGSESFTTMELKVNFLRPVWTGRLLAKAKVLKKGRTTGLITCRVLGPDGRLVAFATCTCMTILAQPGAGLVRERRATR
jgi:uncharacterized protein (TIGR00369 family)